MSHWRVKLQITQNFLSKYFRISHPRTKHISHVWIPVGVSLRKTNPHIVSLFVDSYSSVSISFLSRICQRLYIAVGCHSSVVLFFFCPFSLLSSFISSFTNWYFLRMPRSVILSYCMLLKHSSLAQITAPGSWACSHVCPCASLWISLTFVSSTEASGNVRLFQSLASQDTLGCWQLRRRFS